MAFDPDKYNLDSKQLKVVLDANAALEHLQAQCIETVALARCGGLASWTFESYRQLWLRRILALADGAAAEWSAGRLVNLAILLRALHESVASFNHVLERGKDLIVAGNLRAFHRLTIDMMHCTRMPAPEGQPALPVSTNVLTMIDRMDRALSGTRWAYDVISELVHPNGEGLWMYGESRSESHELKLGEFSNNVDHGVRCALFGMAVLAMADTYATERAPIMMQHVRQLEGKHGPIPEGWPQA